MYNNIEISDRSISLKSIDAINKCKRMNKLSHIEKLIAAKKPPHIYILPTDEIFNFAEEGMIRSESSSITQTTMQRAIISSVFFFPSLDPAVFLARSNLPSRFKSLDNSFGGSPISLLLLLLFPSSPYAGDSRRSGREIGDRETVFARVCCMPVKEEVCV